MTGKTLGIFILTLSLFFSGCSATYQKCVRPTPALARLSPELANLTDEKIDLYLRSNVKPVFPTVLAVAKLTLRYSASSFTLETIRGKEAEEWRKMAGPGRSISQVHFLNPLLMDDHPLNLKKLRDTAALVHAPLLLVYLQTDNSSEGYNSSAIAYWSIVGLFVVPGNTVGHYAICQAILVDTRTGVILATDQTDSIGKRMFWRVRLISPANEWIKKPMTTLSRRYKAISTKSSERWTLQIVPFKAPNGTK